MMAHLEMTVPETESLGLDRKESTRQEVRYAMPAVDIYEKEEALTLLADLPGVTPDNLSVNLENGILTIIGKVEIGAEEEHILKEFEPTSFYRQFRISEAIDAEKIGAVMKHGVLTLTLPKVERAKPRKIPVSRG